jgi:hypothetical protein
MKISDLEERENIVLSARTVIFYMPNLDMSKVKSPFYNTTECIVKNTKRLWQKSEESGMEVRNDLGLTRKSLKRIGENRSTNTTSGIQKKSKLTEFFERIYEMETLLRIQHVVTVVKKQILMVIMKIIQNRLKSYGYVNHATLSCIGGR